jgi:hypothetical protein
LRRRADFDAAVVLAADAVHAERRAGQVAGKLFESVGFIVADELVGINGKARRIPPEQLIQKGLGKTLRAVEPGEEQASEALFDVGEEGGGRHRAMAATAKSGAPARRRNTDIMAPYTS